jgi:hypothetical protein
MKEHFKAQGRKPAHKVETAGKIVNIAFKAVFLEGNPADEM